MSGQDRRDKAGGAIDLSALNIRDPALIMLIGPPASGKSTWRKAYQQARAAAGLKPAVVISSDDKVEQLARAAGQSYSQYFPRVDMRALNEEIDRERQAAIRAGSTLIVDRVNLMAGTRRFSLSGLPGHYQRVGLVFTAAPETLEQRLADRARTEGKAIDMAVVRDMLTTFDPPEAKDFDLIRYIDTDRKPAPVATSAATPAKAGTGPTPAPVLRRR